MLTGGAAATSCFGRLGGLATAAVAVAVAVADDVAASVLVLADAGAATPCAPSGALVGNGRPPGSVKRGRRSFAKGWYS